MIDWSPTGVELIKDVSVADWAVADLAPWGREIRLASFIPSGFEAYARVFPPARVQSGPEIGALVSWGELARKRGIALTPDVTFAEVSGLDPENDFTAFINMAPEQGRLEPIGRTLVEILRSRTATPAVCWFCV